ncbi:MAG: hypothetical protein P4N59_11830 [Negativicutes bacterium]|nr:hypothetical protein [Negativicutes bacterium]
MAEKVVPDKTEKDGSDQMAEAQNGSITQPKTNSQRKMFSNKDKVVIIRILVCFISLILVPILVFSAGHKSAEECLEGYNKFASKNMTIWKDVEEVLIGNRSTQLTWDAKQQAINKAIEECRQLEKQISEAENNWVVTDQWVSQGDVKQMLHYALLATESERLALESISNGSLPNNPSGWLDQISRERTDNLIKGVKIFREIDYQSFKRSKYNK